jgi:hypothetical protein
MREVAKAEGQAEIIRARSASPPPSVSVSPPPPPPPSPAAAPSPMVGHIPDTPGSPELLGTAGQELLAELAKAAGGEEVSRSGRAYLAGLERSGAVRPPPCVTPRPSTTQRA